MKTVHAVLVNPHAGAVRRDDSLPDALRDIADGAAEIRVTRDPEVLREVAADLAGRGVRHIAIVGGDGSASLTLTAIAEAFGTSALPTIALLRGGTMNTVARSIGVRRMTTEQLLRHALRAWRAPERARFRVRPTLQIAGRLGFLFGTGIWPGFLEAYYRAGNDHPTPLTAATVVVQGAMSALMMGGQVRGMLDPRKLTVRSALGEWPARPYVTVAAGTVEEAGLGFRPFHRAFTSDKQFQLLGVKARVSQVARELPRVLLGYGFRPETALSGMTDWVEIESPDGRVKYSIDGDLQLQEGPLRVTVGPSFSFLTA